MPESISRGCARKHSTGIYQKTYQWTTPESMAWISNLHRRWTTPESIPWISSLYKRNWKKEQAVQKLLKKRTKIEPETPNYRLWEASKESKRKSKRHVNPILAVACSKDEKPTTQSATKVHGARLTFESKSEKMSPNRHAKSYIEKNKKLNAKNTGKLCQIWHDFATFPYLFQGR